MRLLALAAAAAALASVMALSVGPANAQPSRSDFYEFACIDSKGQCYTDDSVTNPLSEDEAIGVYGGERFVNLYRPGDSYDRYVNAYPGAYGYGLPAPGLFGIALAEALAGYPDDSEDRFVNYGGDLVIGDNVAACEARYRSYDRNTGLYLGYDGNYHPCRL